METWKCKVGSKVVFEGTPPGVNWRDSLRRACEIHVPATPDQDKQDIYLWEGTDKLYLPRGILPILKDNPLIDLEVLDCRFTWTISGAPECRLQMRPHQEEQVRAICNGKEGIIVAPPGAGKTIAVLEAIRRTDQKALIIVNRLNIARQWKDAWEQLTGDNDWGIFDGASSLALAASTHRLNIVLQQTLQNYGSREIDAFNFGFVCLDECHHVSAKSYTHTVGNFRARYRIGVSATPTRADGLEKISQLILGPVLHRIKSEKLDGSVLIKPSVEFVQTDFSWKFWGTHSVNKLTKCDVPNCPKIGKAHSHRNNYADVISALAENDARNFLIVRALRNNRTKCNLVVSDRLGHLDALRELCLRDVGFDGKTFDPDRLLMLTGRESVEERERVYRMARYGECVIFSTIAKEALDIPRLDRIYLTWPVKSDHILEQQIGRICRTHPDKKDAVVIDFVDRGSGVLASQSLKRWKYYKQKLYETRGW